MTKLTRFNGRFSVLPSSEWVFITLPAVTALLLYLPALDLAFFQDDPGLLRWVAGKPILSFLTSAQGFHYWRPLPFLLWKMLRGILGSFQPGPFHFLNILVHAANTVLVYVLLRRLTGQRIVALFAGVIQGVHPFNFDLAYVSTFWYPLGTLFVLMGFLLYDATGRAKSHSAPLIGLSLGTYVLALLSHESGLLLLPIVVSRELIFESSLYHPPRHKVRALVGYVVLAVVYLIWWSQVPKDPLDLPPRTLSDLFEGSRLFLGGLVFPILWPGSTLISQLGLPCDPSFLTATSAILILGLFFVTREAWHRRVFVFSLVWWLWGALIPLTTLPAGYVLGSHRLFYFSSVGAAGVWGLGLWALGERARHLLSPASRWVMEAIWAIGIFSIVASAVPFVWARLETYGEGSALIKAILREGLQHPPEEVFVYVNLPAFVPIGDDPNPDEFLPLQPDPQALFDVMEGKGRRVEMYVSADLGLGKEASLEEAPAWRQFVTGRDISLGELIRIAILADRVYIFEHDDWQILELDAHAGLLQEKHPELVPLVLVRDQLRRGKVIYLSWPGSNYQDLFDRYRLDGGVKVFDGQHTLILRVGEALYVIEDSAHELFFPGGLQGLQIIKQEELQVDDSSLVFAEIEISPGWSPRMREPIDETIGSQVRLLGFDLIDGTSPVTAGEKLEVVLYWQVLDSLDKNYTVFVHLLGSPNPATGSPLWAQVDSYPGRGSYPTSAWEAGEIILDRYTLEIPANVTPGLYELRVGMYDLDTLERLPIDSARAADNSLPLTTLKMVRE